MSTKTVGQQVLENREKNHILTDDVQMYTEEMSKEILSLLQETITAALKHDLYQNRDFYIVLVKNVDRVLGEPKFQIWARRSCPTPVYKQDVWKYHHESGELEFLWCIPSAVRYWDIIRNTQKYFEDKRTARLAKFVTLMESGELLKWVKRENGELKDAIITINKENN